MKIRFIMPPEIASEQLALTIIVRLAADHLFGRQVSVALGG